MWLKTHAMSKVSFKACDVVNIDETNVDFDFVSGTPLAGHGK
jgi:hypothetical protein